MVVAIALLAGALVFLLVSGPLFSDGPTTDIERDYQLLVKGLAENPKDPAVLMSLAEVEYELGRTEDALKHAELALKYAEDGPYYNLRFATLMVREGELDRAVKSLEKEIELAEGADAEPYFLLAQVKSEQKEHDEAIELMQEGLGIEPNAADMRIVLGEIYERAGKTELAIGQFRAALKFLPDEQRAIDGLQRLGLSYEQTTTPDPHGAGTGE